MDDAERENDRSEKFVQDRSMYSFGENTERPAVRKVRRGKVRYVSEPHIEPYKVKGRIYYRYRHGVGKPIHLGTADAILAAVELAKGKRN